MKTVEILGANRFETYTKTRESSRAIIIKDGNILLTHELNSGWWLLPGGGLEAGETYEECVIREVKEETGYLVRPIRRFLIMNEYYEEYRYSGYFFVCEVTGNGHINLTDVEKQRGVQPEWIPLSDAIKLFSKHESYADVSEEKRGVYQREYLALKEYMALDSECHEQQIYERFPGISCAYRDAAGREILTFSGIADAENGIPVDGNTVFPACSISKFVTAITVMILQEQKLLNIDEPVNRYLSQWKLLTVGGIESDATVRSILSHTAGIADGEDSFYGLRRSDPEIGLMDILEGRTAYNKRQAITEKQPGTEFEYSDAGYCVLQLMIQEIMHCSFEKVVEKNVFEPLRQKKTFFASLHNLELWEKNRNMAAGYDNEGSLIPGKYPQIPDLAASGLWSTPDELMMIAKEFIEAVNGRGSLLRKESAREMIKPAENFSWVGLGLFLRDDDTLVSQGWGENGQCILKMNAVTGEISVVMTNRDPGVDQTESGLEQLALLMSGLKRKMRF
ncbi:MAG: serine hydrolase [Lachnospiraceae bacterium]|nr:serine hydrolase [Lachnospiraceae bacterium]